MDDEYNGALVCVKCQCVLLLGIFDGNAREVMRMRALFKCILRVIRETHIFNCV